VKQQLLKQQELVRQQGMVPPTKVRLILAGNIVMKIVQQPNQPVLQQQAVHMLPNKSPHNHIIQIIFRPAAAAAAGSD